MVSLLFSGKASWIPGKESLGDGRQHLLGILVTFPSPSASCSSLCTWGQSAAFLLLGHCVGDIACDELTRVMFIVQMTEQEWTGLSHPWSPLHPRLAGCFPPGSVCGRKPSSTASASLSRATGVSLAMSPPGSPLGSVLQNISGSLHVWAGISLTGIHSSAPRDRACCSCWGKTLTSPELGFWEGFGGNSQVLPP